MEKVTIRIAVLVGLLLGCVCADAQNLTEAMPADTVTVYADSLTLDALSTDSLALDALDTGMKSLKALHRKVKRDWTTWRPDIKRALWLSIVLPGAGQIYNRKYWKLPLVYGGFVGCIYAMRWNNQMYHDYSQAYLDLMDDDPKTESYNQFMHLGAQINSGNITRYQELFKKRKDRFRRWRDMSFFVMVGVYALSIVDAYVDASLSEFDISDDLSLHLAPAVLNNKTDSHSWRSSAVGLQCSLNF